MNRAFAILSIIYLSINLSAEEGSPKLRGEFFDLKRGSKTQEYYQKSIQKEIVTQTHKLDKAKKTSLLEGNPFWQELGPGNIGGRVRSISIHPTDENKVWIAAASGGLWYTSDGGLTWASKFNNGVTQSFGAIEIDPNNPSTIYAASGEGANNIDSYPGSGIFKSTDNGDSWFSLGLRNVTAFNKIICHPQNSNIIYAGGFGSDPGLYRSIDGGDSWENILKKQISDISIKVDNINLILASTEKSGVYISRDFGDNFDRILSENDINSNSIGRTSAQFSNSSNVCLALIEDGDDGDANIFKSEDLGENWYSVFQNNSTFFGVNNQGFYNNFIQIHPKNERIYLTGGIQLFRSTNGASIRPISNIDGSDIHVDQHCLEFAPSNPNIVYLGNDGGVYKSTNSGKDWYPINNGLYITQFYGIDVDQSFSNSNFGGTQDNNNLTNRFTSQSWYKIGPGDGFEPQVSRNDPNIAFIQTQFGRIYKLDLKKGLTDEFTMGLPPRNSKNSLFKSPLRLSHKKELTLYHGGKKLWEIDATNNDASWVEKLSISDGFISAIEPSKINDNELWVGTSSGEIYFSPEGETWVKKNFENGLKRFITDIQTSYINPNFIYVSYSTYDGSRIIFSEDKGDSWRDISLGLPNLPVNDIELDRFDINKVYLANDIGVYYSDNNGLGWSRLGLGMPFVPVNDIDIYEDFLSISGNRFLRAGTHGRSIWQLNIDDINSVDPQIVFPVGGESFAEGSLIEIFWKGILNPSFEISLDNGESWEALEISESNQVRMPWKSSNNAFIRMSNKSDFVYTKTFSIKKRQEGELLQSKTIGGTPYGIDFVDGKIYSCDFYGNKIKVFDKNINLIEEIILNRNFRYYTDLDVDLNNQRIYLTRLNNESGNGGKIDIFNIDGTFVETLFHPSNESSSYPIGIVKVGNNLFVSDRDGEQKIYEIGIESKELINEYFNPCISEFGPRGLDEYNDQVIQLCTEFEENRLIDTKISLIQNEQIFRVFSLKEYKSNPRGLAIDKTDGNIWVSGFGGEIRKYQGFEGIASYNENIFDANIFPQPANEYFFITGLLVSEIEKIQLLNISGDIRINLNYEIISDKSVKINLSNLISGIYYVNLRFKSGISKTHKLVLAK